MGIIAVMLMAWFGLGLAAAALNLLHMVAGRLRRRPAEVTVLTTGYAEAPAQQVATAKVPVAA